MGQTMDLLTLSPDGHARYNPPKTVDADAQLVAQMERDMGTWGLDMPTHHETRGSIC